MNVPVLHRIWLGGAMLPGYDHGAAWRDMLPGWDHVLRLSATCSSPVADSPGTSGAWSPPC